MRLLFLTALLCGLAAPTIFANPSSNPQEPRLATPAGLDKDVKFWERVFGQFDPDECAFHDEWNLDVIYYIAPVPRVGHTSGSSLLKQHLRAIRTTLSKLESGGEPRSEFERKIYNAIPERLRHREFYSEAQNQVRCQRGVEFNKSLARSRPYIKMIKQTLRDKGLPEDLAYLPHLESGFDRFATSRVGAKGLWQFMAQTARAEGLRVRKKIDWRTDPVLSTDAATDHLASIFLKTQSWELAITAYNYGQNGVMRAIQKFGPDYMKIRTEHRTKLFGFAARNYYPSFLAARNVALREESKLAETNRDGQAIAERDNKITGESVTF